MSGKVEIVQVAVQKVVSEVSRVIYNKREVEKCGILPREDEKGLRGD